MNKSKKTVTTEDTAKVVATKPSKKTNAKDTKQPKKASVTKKTTKSKKPVAKKLPAKSKAVKKLIDAASPTKVSPRHSSEFTRQVEVRILPKDAKVISSTPMVETNYLAYCLFKRDNCLLTEIIGTYTTMQLANEAIDAREVYHAQQGNHVIQTTVTDIPVDHIGNDGYAPIVYEERLIQDDEDLEPVTLVHEALVPKAMQESVEEPFQNLEIHVIVGTGVKRDDDGIYRRYSIVADAVTDSTQIPISIASATSRYIDQGYTDVHFYSYKAKDVINGVDPEHLSVIMTAAKYAQCQGIKDVLVGCLTNSLYMPVK